MNCLHLRGVSVATLFVQPVVAKLVEPLAFGGELRRSQHALPKEKYVVVYCPVCAVLFAGTPFLGMIENELRT